MKLHQNALLHQVELLTTMMGLSILSMVISSFVIFHAQGTGSPIRKEAEEEIKGKAATKKTEQATRDGPRPSQNVNKQYSIPPSDLGRDIVNNPSGRATNNQPTEETGDQLPQASKEKHLEEVDGNHRRKEVWIEMEPKSVRTLLPQNLPKAQTRCSEPQNDRPLGHGMASSLQTDIEDKTKEFTGTMVDIPQPARVEKEVLQMERAFQISWGVIGLSTTMLGVYLGLLGNNKNVSDHMVPYEVSLWLLYTSLFLGLIMLMITVRPLLCSFIHGLMSLALLSGTCAISLGIYILLPKSTFRLVIVFVPPTALFLVAMILYFKDSSINTARKFGFKPHQK